MKGTILEQIIDAKRKRLVLAKQRTNVAHLIKRARSLRSDAVPHRLRSALSKDAGLNIIAEFKRASPSKGIINDAVAPSDAAIAYEKGGAAAISVLTEEDFFKGSLDDLRAVRKTVSLPVLRKDFVVDEFQIYEAAEAGADAVLLIVAALTSEKLKYFLAIVETELGMDALVEVHTQNELDIVDEIGAQLIGVNNRDLKTFDVSLNVSRQLITEKPVGSLMIAESGIVSRDEMIELRSLGFDGFLVGETLMRSGEPGNILEAWV